MAAKTSNDSDAGSKEPLVDNLPQFLGLVRGGKRAILWSAGICLGLALLYLIVSPPLYEATTQLLVLRQSKKTPNVSGKLDAMQAMEGSGLLQDDFVPTQIAIVRSPEVIRRAIDAVGLDNLPTLKRRTKEDEDPAQVAIKNYLRVKRPDLKAKVIRIDYRARGEDEAVRMLEAITASYRKFLTEHYERDTHLVTVLDKARSEMSGELAQAERKYAEFRQKHPLVSTDKEGHSLLLARLGRWDGARNQLHLREVQLQGQLELAQKLSRQGAGLWAIAHIMGQLSGDTGDKNGLLSYSTNVAQMTSWDYVKQLSLEQQELAERYGPQYSRVQEIQERIARIQERVRTSRGEMERADIKDLLTALEQGLKASQAIRAELDRDFTADKAQESDLIEETRLRNEVERRMLLFNFTLNQLKQAEVARDFESVNTDAVESVNIPDRRLWWRYLLVVAAALMFGLSAGTLLVLGREKYRPHLRSEPQVRRTLGLAVVGRLPSLHGRPSARAGLAAATTEDQRDRASLHTNLDLLRRRRLGLKVVLVAGPRAGAGATMTASNLAVSLARAGQRTLLIDADLRQSSVARLHALAVDRGLNQILQGEAPISKVIQRCPVEKLDALAAGAEVVSSTPLLLSPRLKNLLTEVRGHYDVVIVDSPAVLESPDACILAPLADGVLLVVRDGATGRADAEDAVRLLRKMKAPLLGAIFNDAQGPAIHEADRVADLLAGIDAPEESTDSEETGREPCPAREVIRNGHADR
ncbi:MAG TPA: polysaccharide biosynthesis tyrosine autokinase [Gemmataceae bacterium]|jgi:capsular exopolysaccharide synthesis family protein